MDFECSNTLKIIGVICCLFLAIPIKIPPGEHDPQHLFDQFVRTFNKSYLSNETEYRNRFENFKKSLKTIEKLNATRTEGSAFYGVTEFSDQSPEEFKATYLKRMHLQPIATRMSKHKRSTLSLPEKVDWRLRDVVTSVRDQRLCGACWAFSTIETIETMNALKNGTLRKLSVQQMIDCAKNGNLGCEGGDARLLLEWIIDNKIRLELEEEYPYKYGDDRCQYTSEKGSVEVAGFTCKNAIGAEDTILELLANHGPVAVAVNAANWQYYLGGVIQYHCAGSLGDLNHAAQIVGYVTSAMPPYYIVRNSWGPLFGLQGYLHLSINSNTCGVASEVCSIDVV